MVGMMARFVCMMPSWRPLLPLNLVSNIVVNSKQIPGLNACPCQCLILA